MVLAGMSLLINMFEAGGARDRALGFWGTVSALGASAQSAVALTRSTPAGALGVAPQGLAAWARGYLLMLRFDLSRQRQWLRFAVALQVLLGAGIAIVVGFYAPHLPPPGILSNLTTGLVTEVGTSYLVPGSWILVGCLAVAWVVGHRHAEL